MKTTVLYDMPFSSTDLAESVRYIFSKKSVWILYAYFNHEDNDEVYNSGVVFHDVQCFKQMSEVFLQYFYENSYDSIVEILDSEWLKELKEIYTGNRPLWYEPHHFALYMNGAGLFELCSSRFEVLPVQRGCIGIHNHSVMGESENA